MGTRCWLIIALMLFVGCAKGYMKEDPKLTEELCAEQPEAPLCKYVD